MRSGEKGTLDEKETSFQREMSFVHVVTQRESVEERMKTRITKRELTFRERVTLVQENWCLAWIIAL